MMLRLATDQDSRFCQAEIRGFCDRVQRFWSRQILWGAHRLQATVGQSHHQGLGDQIHTVGDVGDARREEENRREDRDEKSQDGSPKEALEATGSGSGKINLSIHRLR